MVCNPKGARTQRQKPRSPQPAPSTALSSLSRPGRFMARRAKAWKSCVSAALVLLALFVPTLPVLAAVTGDIRGIVLDPQGLPVAAAKVTVRNLETGTSRSVATDSAGAFAVLQLAVGSYEIRIEKQGFLALVTTVDVRSGEVAEADGSLQVGSVNQSVTVAAGARTYLDAASAQVATSLDATTIQADILSGPRSGSPDVSGTGYRAGQRRQSFPALGKLQRQRPARARERHHH